MIVIGISFCICVPNFVKIATVLNFTKSVILALRHRLNMYPHSTYGLIAKGRAISTLPMLLQRSMAHFFFFFLLWFWQHSCVTICLHAHQIWLNIFIGDRDKVRRPNPRRIFNCNKQRILGRGDDLILCPTSVCMPHLVQLGSLVTEIWPKI